MKRGWSLVNRCSLFEEILNLQLIFSFIANGLPAYGVQCFQNLACLGYCSICLGTLFSSIFLFFLLEQNARQLEVDSIVHILDHLERTERKTTQWFRACCIELKDMLVKTLLLSRVEMSSSLLSFWIFRQYEN